MNRHHKTTHDGAKYPADWSKGPATRNDIVDDIVDVSSSTMAFNVANIASARASLTISLTKSLRVAGPLIRLVGVFNHNVAHGIATSAKMLLGMF